MNTGRMVKVECEGCKAPYQVDERRVPATGLKMRCPKCGTSFVVRQSSASGETSDTELPALARPREAGMSSNLGADLPAVRAGARPAPIARSAAAALAAPASPSAFGFELDLPDAVAGLPEARSGARAPARLAPPPRPGAMAPGALASAAAPLLSEAALPVPAVARPPHAAAGPQVGLATAEPRKPPPFPVGPPAEAKRPPVNESRARDSDLPAVFGGPPAADLLSDDDLAFDLPGLVPAGLPMAASSLPSVARPTTSAAAGAAAPRSPPKPGFGEIDLPLLTNDAPALAGALPTAAGRVAESSSGGSDPPEPTLSLAPDARHAVPPESVPPVSLLPESVAPESVDAWGEPGELDDPAMLTGPSAPPARPPSGRADAAFGELSFPEAAEEASIGFSDSIPPEPPPSSSRADAPVSDDDMEFGEIPQQKADDGPLQPELAVAPRTLVAPPAAVVAAPRPISPHRAKIVGAVLAAMVIGGASLEVISPWGAFGRHALLDRFNRDKLLALQANTIDEVHRHLAADTYREATQAIATVDEAIGSAPRAVGLLPYGAFVAYLTELRYGRAAMIDAHAKQLLAQASERQPLPFTGLALAAEAAVESQLPRAKQTVDALAEVEPQNVDVAVLVAEVQLLAKDYDKALEGWTRASALDGGTARSAFGMARALSALGKDDAALDQAKKVLTLSPTHVGARLLSARSRWFSSHDESGALAALNAVTEKGAVRNAASPAELVDALTLTALVHMSRSRMSLAEAALTEALSIDPKAASALAGMGEVLYREGRFTDALARFEAGIQADPEGSAAKIGAAKTKIALERLAEAKEQLKKLRDARPSDPEVTYWMGRAEEALGDRALAERGYRDAIASGAGQSQTVQAYIALSQLLASAGHPEQAEQQLADAKAKLPHGATVDRAVGDVHLAAGRFEAAKEEFESAIAQEPGDIASRFRLGVVARRMGNLDEAEQLLAKIAEQDPEYPALALERGLLYEARNQTAQALTYYQQALSKAPDDPDLMLRVGSAEVASGHATQAEDILRKVISKRPNSAEVNHYLGRALLLKGNNLAEALRYLKRAVEIDANRPEYHLYVGWAANDVGQPAVAQEELGRALDLDKGLADAYWQQGVMQRKQGAVFDAVKSLKKALELRPSRYEAYATLAECYEDQNKVGDAIAAWRKAIAADSSRAEWHYRLGKLLGRTGETELREAVTAGESLEPAPAWLSQAYFELGDLERSVGKRDLAVAHLRKFLALGKVDSPYRPDALKALAALGAPYDPSAP